MLLDTSGLLCYFDDGEVRHPDAVTFFHTAPSRFTHSYILAEFSPLCHARGLNRARALAFINDLIDTSEVDVVWVDEYLHRAALVFLQGRLDKSYSPCDAIRFLLMKSWGVEDALTTDRHFEQEGYVRLFPA
jgi:uncharacterized protein